MIDELYKKCGISPSDPGFVKWRKYYRHNRYARHLTTQELFDRIASIMVNLFFFTEEGKFGLPSPKNDETKLLFEKFTHATEEMQIRHGLFPAGYTKELFKNFRPPDFTDNIYQNSSKEIYDKYSRLDNVYIKYGQKEFITPFYESGNIRIQSASHFKELSHNGAIRDDELSFSFSAHLNKKGIQSIVENPHDVKEGSEQRVEFHLNHPTDFWLFCLTDSVETRLFVDFKADSCIIIKDTEEFDRRMEEASKHFSSTQHRSGIVSYIDPIFDISIDLDIPFSKSFAYQYQKERRYCWIPQEIKKKVSYKDISIGNLEDIADIFIL